MHHFNMHLSGEQYNKHTKGLRAICGVNMNVLYSLVATDSTKLKTDEFYLDTR